MVELHRIINEQIALDLREFYRVLGYRARILLDPFDEDFPWVVKVY